MTRVKIPTLPSGVPGLDEVLGGGIPELSLNLITGGPGCGKTTLGHQIAFANASKNCRALYVSIIGEPPLKMLRYQQQFSFFDEKKIDRSIHFLHLGDEARDGGLDTVLERIIAAVDRLSPQIVVVDSFRSMMRPLETGESVLQDFIQRLALHLTTCQATTFLIGELEGEEHESPIFTVADGIVTLAQSAERNSVVRKLQVVKMRGQGQIPGLQTMRITSDGLNVFPRLLNPEPRKKPTGNRRLPTGAKGLDALFGGGIPRGHSVLITGPSGSGKTILSNQFIVEGARHNESGVIAVFERRPNDYMQTTPFGRDFRELIAAKKLEILYLRPLDLSIDETLLEIQRAVHRVGASRAVIDSLSGLELALAPTFREDFRESLYRMVSALTGLGVTVMSTVEMADSYGRLEFSPQGIAFLTDAIVMQRYFMTDGEIRRALAVVKLRGSTHSKQLCEYEITPKGRLEVGKPLRGFTGLLTGAPERSSEKKT